MSFVITSNDYVKYINNIAKRIYENRDYITNLDAATGDGDHWVNINMGFENLVEASDELKNMPIYEVFKKIGMLMMSKIGGSSHSLWCIYSSIKAISSKNNIMAGTMYALEAMVNDMMVRGKAKPGFKTMIDVIQPQAISALSSEQMT